MTSSASRPRARARRNAVGEEVRRLARLERADEEEVRRRRRRPWRRLERAAPRAGPRALAPGPGPTRRAVRRAPPPRRTAPPPPAAPATAAAPPRATPLVAREVLGRTSHERSWTVSTNGVAPGAKRRRGGRPGDVDRPHQPVQPRPNAPGANRTRDGQRMPDRDDPARHHRAPPRQQHAVLVVRELRRQGLEQRGRIVRHPACPAADQAAPVDPDPHARCPVTASPSTPAPPPAPSSAGWSAGRASSPRACRPRPDRYEVARAAAAARPPRRPRVGAARAAAPRRPRAGAAVPGQPRAARAPAQRDRDPRRRARSAIPSGTRPPTRRGSGESCRPWPVARSTS